MQQISWLAKKAAYSGKWRIESESSGGSAKISEEARKARLASEMKFD